jgi:DegV family protein with EDD domain
LPQIILSYFHFFISQPPPKEASEILSFYQFDSDPDKRHIWLLQYVESEVIFANSSHIKPYFYHYLLCFFKWTKPYHKALDYFLLMLYNVPKLGGNYMSRFFCDSNSEISLLDFHSLKNINLIKMPYTVDDDEFFYDLGESTDLYDFFNRMRQGAVVKTQALNPYDYVEYFEPVLSSGEDVLYISFSHKLSGTFASLAMAKEELLAKYPERKITVVDTKAISQGAGVVVKMAAMMHAEGKSDEEIVSAVESYRSLTGVYFCVESLEYLRRGGRLSSFSAFLGTLLNLKPIITLSKEGSLISGEKVNGTKKALKKLADFLTKEKVDLSHEIIIMQGDAIENAEFLRDVILEAYPEAKTRIQMIGPVIGCHCGPGTIGMIFVKKEG